LGNAGYNLYVPGRPPLDNVATVGALGTFVDIVGFCGMFSVLIVRHIFILS
jgi:hypothetical protein